MPQDASDESLDLTPEQRRRIDELFARLGQLDDHGVLGVSPDSDRANLRRAYFNLMAEFHPDRFFRKRLGPYKPKMEAITRRVSLAYETLAASRTKRTATSSAPPAPKADPAREKALAALKQQIEARHAEARRLAAEAQKAAAHGDLASAADAYRRAVALAPKDGAIQAAYEQTRRAVETSASEGYARQAEFEERFEHWAEAATSWKRVLDARPDDARARDRLATALRRAGGGQSGAGS